MSDNTDKTTGNPTKPVAWKYDTRHVGHKETEWSPKVTLGHPEDQWGSNPQIEFKNPTALYTIDKLEDMIE